LPENIYTIETKIELKLIITDYQSVKTWLFSKYMDTNDVIFCVNHITELYYSEQNAIPEYVLKRFKNIKKLVFTEFCDFNQEIDLEYLKFLEELSFNSKFNQKIDLSYNINLKSLSFGYSFNQELNLSYNINLKSLSFGYNFNQKINLEHQKLLSSLSFGYAYNQETDISMLYSLTFLMFGYNFNRSINLENLTLLKHLIIKNRYKQHLDLSNQIMLETLETQRKDNITFNKNLKFKVQISDNDYIFTRI
jgi:hypothetical protein